MNSRERILTALEGRQADRVPISTYELVGYNSRAFENQDSSYTRLMDSIRQYTDCICMWEPASNATFLQSAHPVEIEEKVTREGNGAVSRKTLRTARGSLTRTTRTTDNIQTVWQVEHWCKTLNDVDAALSIPFEPVQYDFSDLERIHEELGDHGIVMSSIADPLWLAADLMEFGAYTVWAKTEAEHFARTVDALHERAMHNLKRMLDSGVVDLYRICGPEYATPPYLPPALFQRYVVPYVSEMVELIHSRGAKARLHCHGKTGQVLEMIQATGADAVDPCEAPPDGDVSLDEVKRRIGDQMCIFGNIQIKLLEHGATDDVKRAVIECMNSAKDGGGYVIMPTAAPISTPLAQKTEENYMCYIETALEYGSY